VSLSTGRTKLDGAMKTLRLRWQEVQEAWNDPVRHDFEEHYWAPVEPAIAATLRAIDRLDQILCRARQECG